MGATTSKGNNGVKEFANLILHTLYSIDLQERSKILQRWYEQLMSHQSDLAKIITLEQVSS